MKSNSRILLLLAFRLLFGSFTGSTLLAQTRIAVALNHILADNLTYTHTGGNTQTKAEFISSLREKKIRYNSIEFEDANARVYGNTAVIASRVHVKVTVDGRDIRLHPCFLHVWVKRNGRWQLVAHQATQIQ